MNTVERIKGICKERRIPISRLERDLGFANAYISQLRKGVVPSDRLAMIADYLGVSTQYLIDGETKKDQPGEGLVNDDPELTEYLQELQSRPEMKMLFHTFKTATKEQIEAIVTAWEARNNIKGE